MIKEVARYGSFKKRGISNDKSTGGIEISTRAVSYETKMKAIGRDAYNPWLIYDYDIDYDNVTEEVNSDGCDILKQDDESSIE